jgi:hypothetical protein
MELVDSEARKKIYLEEMKRRPSLVLPHEAV